jgi:uncharacterized membrane-anchored protein
MITIPADHPRRVSLNDEAHARPPEALEAPSRISFMALEDDGIARADLEAPLRALCARYGRDAPPAGANHFSSDFGTFRVTWEKHTEFTRYMIVAPGGIEQPFAEPAIASVPGDWLKALPGKLIAAAHVDLRKAGDAIPDVENVMRRHFAGNALVGATIADGLAMAFGDFRIHADGFSRFLVLDRGLAPRQAGRTVQRLLEIDAYRMLAMLALPLARERGPQLGSAERELADITASLATEEAKDEPELLDKLTRLEAQIQQRLFETAPRFSASEAYYRLIQRRTGELREQRFKGVQTFHEFVERRLGPAMNTCFATSARQEKLSQRVAETTQLLSTRVEVTRQRQAQAALESMNRRALLQLRMQETVEGLSVAAITYYVVGLIGYVVKGFSSTGLVTRPDVVVALSVPLVVLFVALGVRRIRRLVAPLPASGIVRRGATE